MRYLSRYGRPTPRRTAVSLATLSGLLLLLLAYAPDRGFAADFFGSPTQGRVVKVQSSVSPKKVQPGQTVAVQVQFEIDKGWYIYDPDLVGTGLPTVIRVDSDSLAAIGKPKFPKAITKEIEILKETHLIHKGKFEARWHHQVKPGTKPGKYPVKTSVKFLSCHDDGRCLTPDEIAVETIVEIVKSSGESGEEAFNKLQNSILDDNESGNEKPASSGQKGAGEEESQGLWLFLLSAVFWGLFTLLMPCTYPMIPITISVFSKQAEKSDRSLLPLALFYGLGIVAIFIIIGVFVGPPIVAFATGAPLNLVLGILFIVFALSLFGAFEIRLPTFLTSFSAKASMRGGYIGVFILGMTLVVTSFTCTAPFVGALLGTGAKEGYGRLILGMAVFGATVATPFVALGMFPAAAKKMPKQGEWMQTLKVSLGFLELAASLKFFSNVDLVEGWGVLPRELFFLWWTALAFITGLYLLGVIPLKSEPGRSIGAWRMTLGVLVILLGTYWLQGAQGKRLDFISMAIAPPYSNAKEVAHGAGPEANKPGRPICKDDFREGLLKAVEGKRLALVNWTGVT